jgi:hypothetical protein
MAILQPAPAPIFDNAGSTANSFETASLVAIVVHALIGWGIITAPRGTKPATP